MQPPSPARPDGVQAAVWIVVGLSALMAFSALGLMGTALATETIQARFTPHPARPSPELEKFLESQQRMMQASRPDHPAAIGTLMLVVAIAGSVAAFRLHKRRAGAVAWISHASIAIAAVEMVSGVQTFVVQRRAAPLMAEMMSRMPRAPTSPRVAPMVDFMTGAMSGMVSATIFLSLGFVVLKIAVCFYARYCARKPAVAAWIAAADR